MRKNFKRTLAVFCASLTALSVAVAGNLSLLKAAAEVSSAQGTAFGEDNAYLKLDNALESAPTSVEADVKMSSTVKDEWTLFDGSDYQTTVPERVKEGTTTEADTPGAGIDYLNLELNDSTITVIRNLATAVDISKYSRDELVLSFWVYSETAGKLADKGRIRLSKNVNGNNADLSDNNTVLDKYAFNIKVETGWNYIEIPLNTFDLESGGTLTSISCFKLHGLQLNSGDKEIRIADVKLSVKKDATEWTLRDGGIGTQNGTLNQVTDGVIAYTSTEDDAPGAGLTFAEFDAGRGTFTTPGNSGLNIDVSAYDLNELSVEFWCWSEKAAKFTDGGQIRISNDTNTLKDKVLWYLPRISVTAGWNKISIPLSRFTRPTENGNFMYDNPLTLNEPITAFRFNGLKTTDSNIYRIGEVKLVANAENKVYTSDIDESVYNNGYSVFSNLNSSEGDTPYALFVTRDGKPAFIYNDKMFVLNHNICNGEFVKLGVTVNNDGTVTFTVGDIMATSTGAATVPEAPKFTACHSIGADVAGGALMNGSIKNLVIKNGEDAVSWTLSSNKAYPLNAVKASDGTNNAHFAGIENSTDAVVVKYENATAGEFPGNVADMDGYVFAGWFTDKDCTAPLTGTGAAYAKYVDKNVLTVKAQVNQDNNADIRFVTTVDSLDYKLVGFEIEFGGKIADLEKTKTTTVYESLNRFVDGNNTPVSPTVFSPASNFFAAFTVRNVPSDKTSEKFTVRAYWITLDGTAVYGESAQRSIA